MSKSEGKLSEVESGDDGIYTATYTASREGTEVIWVVAPKQRLVKFIEIKLTKS